MIAVAQFEPVTAAEKYSKVAGSYERPSRFWINNVLLDR